MAGSISDAASLRMLRRHFVTGGLAAAATATVSRPTLAVAVEPIKNPIAAFTKFLAAMPYAALAEAIAGLGFDGIEATVRPKGQVLPEKAEGELPKLVEALAAQRLELMIMTTSITKANAASEKLLRLAAGLGIKRYRMGYYHYKLGKPIKPQLAAIRPVLLEVAAMNREIGIQGLYQTHAGATNVGATVWDIAELLDGIPTDGIGLAFDVRHAVAEAGLAWPVLQGVAEPFIAALYVKDCRWERGDLKDVPLGEGRVDRAMVRRCKPVGFLGPISLHVEYLGAAGIEPHLAALGRDLGSLRRWLTDA